MTKSLPNRKRLTDLAVARMGPGICWDTLVVGLGVRIGTKRRTWIVGGNKRKLGLFPAMSVADARAAAREFMLAGEAPAAPVTFKELTERFLQHGRTRKGRVLTRNTLVQYGRNLSRYAQELHQRPIAEIKRRDIANLLRRVAGTSGAATASLVRAMLRRLFEYGIETGEIEANVVSGTPGYLVEKRSRVLTDGEIAAIWAATDDGSEYGMIIRVMFWTGCRRGEAGGMKWGELHGDTWTIPKSRAKNRRELALQLSRQMRDKLREFHRVVGRDNVFGVHSDNGFNGWSAAKRGLDKRLGFSRPWVLHDIRRSVQTGMIALGIGRDVTNQILNHALGPIDAAYNLHDYRREKAAALQLWADHLEAVVGRGAKVVSNFMR